MGAGKPLNSLPVIVSEQLPGPPATKSGLVCRMKTEVLAELGQVVELVQDAVDASHAVVTPPGARRVAAQNGLLNYRGRKLLRTQQKPGFGTAAPTQLN
jgi:hypothetical protein